MRFAGRLRWSAEPSSRFHSSPRALLGADAIDCTAPGGARASVWAWWPAAGATRRGVATAGAVTVLFAGYLRHVPPPHADEAAYVLDRYRSADWHWPRSASG